jgi:subtilase family serine protease
VKGPLKLIVPLAAALGVAACSAGGSSNVPSVSGVAGLSAAHVPQWALSHTIKPACSGSRVGQAQCDVLIQASSNVKVHQAYAGWGAPDLEKAYNLPSSSGGKGQVVGIVDAYDNPDVVSDFNSYRSGMGLPSATLNKYNQTGQQSNYPQGSPNWGVEIDLDVDMVSASCPNCKVILVEANSNAWSDLEASEAEAIKLGATIVSNSYDGTGGSESSYETKGITYLASSGDGGLGLYDPATFQDVIAVGGTVLSHNSDKRGYGEVVWPSTGGGCSDTSEPKPSWQKDPSCSFRTGSDIGAIASDAAEYDTYNAGGWITVAGTSISSPLVAGMVALAGNSTKQTGGENLWKLKKKKLKKDIYPVTVGTDGSCGGSYLCTAGTKQFGIYSGPTGWGTPHGVKEL